MNKIKIYLCAVIACIMVSCDPIENRDEMGGVLQESDLQLEVYSSSEGSNQVIFANNTPNIGSHWNYGSGISIRQRDTVLLPFLGDTKVTFTGICSGGTVSTTRTVKIDKLDHPTEKEWTLLAGTDSNGKVWMWDYDELTDGVWGSGGYPGDSAPAWFVAKAGDMDEQDPDAGLEGTMLFDLNGAANFTKRKKDGTILEKGSFQFDMSKKKEKGDGTFWSIGTLTIIDGSVLKGVSPNEGGITVHELDILTLTQDKLVLGRVMPNGWEAWFWCFKAKK